MNGCPAVTGADVIIADPARRAGGRRITDPAQLLPPLPDLLTDADRLAAMGAAAAGVVPLDADEILADLVVEAWREAGRSR